MNNNMPRTPFSTPLSGSARETEIRLKNIFSGPKKRPPFLLIILTVLVILICGNLVAFRQLPAEPSIVMETQYYDRHGNYVEIPMLALPAGEENQAVDAINTALNNLRRQYSGLLNSSENFWEEQCLFYPSTTGRYLNLLFYQDTFKTDLNTGHVFSLVYDLRKGTLVSTEDALALAGMNEDGLLDQVTEQIQTQIDQDYQEYSFQLALHDLTLEGFRIKADDQPVFYLTGRIDDVDDAVLDAISGADHLYVWENRAVTACDQYSPEPVPLVPAEETDQLDPPLWSQWYFAGEEPAGGFVDESEMESLLPAPYDSEVCLYRDGFSTPIGPLMSINSSFFASLIQNSETVGYEPSYQEGDYWFSADGDGFQSTNYYDPTDGTDSVFLLDVTRTDVSTPRGIRVGDSREAVLAAYPGIYDTPYWDYDGDYLWYCEYEEGFGSAILFFFSNTDTVQSIQLHFLNY